MEEEKQLAGEDRLSGEIVEVYRQPLPGEVVERYSRPLPGRPAAPGQPRRRRRTGLWIFLACTHISGTSRRSRDRNRDSLGLTLPRRYTTLSAEKTAYTQLIHIATPAKVHPNARP